MADLLTHTMVAYTGLRVARVIISILIIATSQQSAIAATRIVFARGSYCGSYSGNFTRGKEFVLGLARGQTFTTRNIGNGTQYNIRVTGPRGRVQGSRGARDQIDYFIPANGDYYVYMQSSEPYNSVEFCAY